MRIVLIGAMLLWTAASLDARAQLPSTDIFIVDTPDDGFFDAATVRNLTDRPGYDNQPRFSPDGNTLFFTSIWEDEQADVYAFDLRKDVRRRVTFTTESEYSPTPTSNAIDVVRVEDDGTQRLWRFSPDGRNAELLFEDLAPVGYFGWMDDDNLAAFIVGDPHALVIANRRTGDVDTIATDIGRTVAPVPGRRAVSYVQKRGGGWSIDMYDLDSGRGGTIVETLPGREDFAWMPDGRILMADGHIMYVWTSGDGTWSRFLDVSAREDIGEVTRIAVSPSGSLIAFVAERAR
jgi:Tol biopolymer transport system component